MGAENPQAFPCANETDYQAGMNLRDWFAGQALAGRMARPTSYKSWADAAADAYEAADAMLAARMTREVTAPAREELPAGMVAWSDGDTAPADWDGGPVLSRGHGLRFPDQLNGGRWGRERTHPFFLENEESCDIIAYTPRATPPEPSSEVISIVEVRRIVEEEGPQNPEHDWTDHARTRAAMRDNILARLASRQPTPAPAADAEVRELLRAIHYVASPESHQSGMTLDGDEVAILSRLLTAASPKAPAVAIDGLEDEIADAIDDSLDMGWTGSIGARAVMKLLRDKGIVA